MIETILSDRVVLSESSSTVGVADKVKRLRAEGNEVYDFSAGRAFEHSPSYVIDAATNAMKSGDTHQTVGQGTVDYRNACARKLARENGLEANPDTEIVATMGCKQGLVVSLLALLNLGDEVIIEDPCFVSYMPTIHYLGGVPVPVPLFSENNFRWKSEQLEEVISDKTRAIIMCTPHNPTGVVHTTEDLEQVAKVAIKHNLTVITDEPYERMTWGDHQHVNLATLPGMAERTITLMSLTKSFSMGGWRLGFAHASPRTIEQLTKLQQHLVTCVSSFAQAGGVVAFGEEPREEVLEYWRQWEEKVVHFTTRLNEIEGLKCYTPEGGFYGWMDITELDISSKQFCNQLLKEDNVALIPGDTFGKQGENYVRVTCVKSWDEINGGLERINGFVQGL